MLTKTNIGFLVLSYHYIRPLKKDGQFPLILVNTPRQLANHVKSLAQYYSFLSPEDVRNFYYSGNREMEWNKTGLLFTFDDGLSDHYLAAKILHKFGINAYFFIPTCILTDGLPANPIIIHYCLAKYGIAKFLAYFRKTAKIFKPGVSIPSYHRNGDKWKTLAEIKKTVNYDIDAASSRKILLYIYKNTLCRDYKNALEIMHLTKPQIQEIIAMGHSIGTHSHSHSSIGSGDLSRSEIERELIAPKFILEKKFGINIDALCYPFGKPADCLNTKDLLSLTKSYDLAFTVEEKINTNKTSPLELGRYMVTGKDTPESIRQKLAQMSKRDITGKSREEKRC